MLDEEHFVIGEDVIVIKANSSAYDRIGQIWKVRVNENRIRISVSFSGEISNFDPEDLMLA